MATRTQVDALAARTARRMCAVYWDYNPDAVKTFIRTLVSETKLIGAPQARRTRNALLREMYNDIFGEDPLNKREFIKWIQSCLAPHPGGLGFLADPVDNVSLDDAFDAEDEIIT